MPLAAGGCAPWGGRAGRARLQARESLTAGQLSSVSLQLLLYLSGACWALHLLATLLMILYKSESSPQRPREGSSLPPRPRNWSSALLPAVLQVRFSATLILTWSST